MTNEQINVAIAEACGWADITRITSNGWLHKKLVGTHKGMPVTFDVHTPIPDYCNDLNAMHQAEETLPDGELWTMKYNLPSQGGLEFRSTARQRAEAFLRTLGKWEEVQG